MGLIASFNKLVTPEVIVQSQMAVGIFLALFGIISFLSFFIKVSKIYAPLFLFLVIPGMLLVRHARKAVLDGKLKDPDPF